MCVCVCVLQIVEPGGRNKNNSRKPAVLAALSDDIASMCVCLLCARLRPAVKYAGGLGLQEGEGRGGEGGKGEKRAERRKDGRSDSFLLIHTLCVCVCASTPSGNRILVLVADGWLESRGEMDCACALFVVGWLFRRGKEEEKEKEKKGKKRKETETK